MVNSILTMSHKSLCALRALCGKKIPFSAVSISDAAAETRHAMSLQKADMKKSPEFIPIYREGI